MFDFPKEIIDLEAVPDDFKNLYEKNNDGFALLPDLATKFAGTAEQEDLQSRLEEANTQLASKDQEISDLMQSADQSHIDAIASQNIAQEKGSVPLLLPHLRARLKVVSDAGKRILQVIEENGTPRRQENGSAFSVKDLVSEMKACPSFSRAFEGPEISGGGMTGSAGGTTNTTVSRNDQSALNARLEEIAAGKISVT